jgi:hypothetical protein
MLGTSSRKQERHTNTDVVGGTLLQLHCGLSSRGPEALHILVRKHFEQYGAQCWICGVVAGSGTDWC